MPNNVSKQDRILENQNSTRIKNGKLSTRLAFFVAGFGLSCWAPLVPFAKQQINADAAEFGSILLCLGLGALLGMPLSGALSARIGSRTVMIAGALGMAVALPLLAVSGTATALGLSLILLGLSLGAIDVAANIHGLMVQEEAGEPLMSGFHGLYSVGGLVGVAAITAAFGYGVSAVVATLVASAVILLSIIVAAPRFFKEKAQGEHSSFVMPKGIVVMIGVLAMITFLVEGAVLDWGALLLTQVKSVDVRIAGSGYTVFALAMAVARFLGDRIVNSIGNKGSLIGGAILTTIGIGIAILPVPLLAVFAGLALAGFGVANIVPILFSLAGRQTVMSASHAVSAAATLGYVGILVGPAIMGYVAHGIGLVLAFSGLAILMIGVAIVSPRVFKTT